MAEPIIKLSGVSKTYGRGKAQNRVLDDLYMQVEEGEFVAVVGTSGSGKSTLLNIIGALDPGFSGEVWVTGQDVGRMSDGRLSQFRNEKVGFVFQQFNLLEHLTCAENVAVPSVFSRSRSGKTHQRVQQALARVGMAERVDDRPASLSGGQKQRIAIARALFNHAPLLLCDEPTGNLDSKTGQQIIELFRALNAEDGRTLIIVTHEARVSEVAHRVIRLEDGRIKGTGSGEQGTQNGGTGEQGRGEG